MSKYFVIALLLSSPLIASADSDMSIRCKNSNVDVCAQKVQTELNLQGCGLESGSVNCQTSTDEQNVTYCSAKVKSCADATSDGFTGVLCNDGGTLVNFSDRQLTADWARSFMWIWVRSFCKI